MDTKQVRQGTIHLIPEILENILKENNQLRELWNTFTPLARNEWICYISLVKKEDTKNRRIKRLQEDLLLGIKRPCCWPGCPHHNKNTQKYLS
jgi:uncharacterized protein YdeI (YjbR/CyaY-like superfamily)